MFFKVLFGLFFIFDGCNVGAFSVMLYYHLTIPLHFYPESINDFITVGHCLSSVHWWGTGVYNARGGDNYASVYLRSPVHHGEVSNDIVLRRLFSTEMFLKATNACPAGRYLSGYIRECTNCLIYICPSRGHGHFNLFGICSLHLLEYLHLLSECG